MATQNVPQSNPRLKSAHRKSKEKPQKRLIRVQLELDLVDALEVIREDLIRRDIADTIRVLLEWAAWAHSCGRDPFGELLHAEPNGCADWNVRIRAAREARELESLYKLGGNENGAA
jgi:hypothetical protein